jgi:two-component system response regulator (stage 0 sporulation protein F)
MELLRKTLAGAGYEVDSVPGAAQALDKISRDRFNLLIIDIKLDGESGIALLRKIRERDTRIPAVLYSGALTPELEKEAREAGANEVLRKDIDILPLVAQIDRIIKAGDRIRSRPAEKLKHPLLVVDDDDGVRLLLKNFFSRKGYAVLEASNGADALRIARSEKVSAVLLDITMPGMDGLETLQRLLEINSRLGIVMTTATEEDDKVKTALGLGAYGYVLKPYDFMYLELVVLSKLIIAETE